MCFCRYDRNPVLEQFLLVLISYVDVLYWELGVHDSHKTKIESQEIQPCGLTHMVAQRLPPKRHRTRMRCIEGENMYILSPLGTLSLTSPSSGTQKP